MIIENESFVVVGEQWGFYPSTTEHLLRRLIKHNQFLWVNEMGCRAPEWNLYTLQRAWGKIIRTPPPDRGFPAETGLSIYSPPVVPLRPISAVRWWNRSAMTRGIMKRLNELNIDRPILFATSPIAAEVMGKLPLKLVIYYILDNYQEMPHHYRSYICELEAQMIDRADIVFATSQPLAQDKSRPGQQVILLPQGVDFDHFHNPMLEGTPIPEDLARIPGPRILFMGLLAPWVDVELLAKTAKAYPKASLVFIGAVRTDVEALRKEANTYFLGQRPYGEIPRYLAHCDAALIPFHENALTRYVNPLKLLEYMAAGLPVISTALPHLKAFAGLIHYAHSSEEFVAQVGKALDGFSPELRAHCIEAARENSWERRAEQLSESLQIALSGQCGQQVAAPVIESNAG